MRGNVTQETAFAEFISSQGLLSAYKRYVVCLVPDSGASKHKTQGIGLLISPNSHTSEFGS